MEIRGGATCGSTGLQTLSIEVRKVAMKAIPTFINGFINGLINGLVLVVHM
jgi:hypothetical protein